MSYPGLNPLKQVKSFGRVFLIVSRMAVGRLNPLKQVKSFGPGKVGAEVGPIFRS